MSVAAVTLCRALLCVLLAAHWHIFGSRITSTVRSTWHSLVAMASLKAPRGHRGTRWADEQLEMFRARNALIMASHLVFVLPLAVLAFVTGQGSASTTGSWMQLWVVVAMVLAYGGAALVVECHPTYKTLDTAFMCGWLAMFAWVAAADEEAVRRAWFVPMSYLYRAPMSLLLQKARRCVPLNFATAALISTKLYWHLPGGSLIRYEFLATGLLTLMSLVLVHYGKILVGTHRGLNALVGSLCDAQVCLTGDMCIKDATPQLAHLLGRGNPIALNGTLLVQHVALPDRERLDSVLSSAGGDDNGPTPPCCMHLDLVAENGTNVPVKLYHVGFSDIQGGEHLIGVQLVGLQSPEELTTNSAPDIPVQCGSVAVACALPTSETASDKSQRADSDASSSYCTLDDLNPSTWLAEVDATLNIGEPGFPIRRLSLVPHTASGFFSSWARKGDWGTFVGVVQQQVNGLHGSAGHGIGPTTWKWPPWSSRPRHILRAEHSELQRWRSREVSASWQEGFPSDGQQDGDEDDALRDSVPEQDDALMVVLKLRGISRVRVPRRSSLRPTALASIGETGEGVEGGGGDSSSRLKGGGGESEEAEEGSRSSRRNLTD